MDKRINFFAVEHEDGTVYTHAYDSGTSECRFFRDVTEQIAFDDCTNCRVICIVWHGRKVRYNGWMPGMHYVYTHTTGKKDVVYEDFFPEFDH